MSYKEKLKFGDFLWKDINFSFPKNLLIKKGVNTEYILISNKYYIWKKCFKYFIVDMNHSNNNIKPFLIWLPVTYLMYLYEKHKDTSNKYSEVWNNIKDHVGKNWCSSNL